MKPLLDELRAKRQRPSTCSVCVWLASRPAAEQAEWAEGFADRGIQTRTLFAAMKARGYTFTDNPVFTHRQNHQ